MINKQVNILITGAGGFIGSFLVKYFQDRYNVFIQSNNTDLLNKYPGITSIEKLTKDFLEKNEINVVIHCAGKAHDITGTSQWQDYLKANVELVKEVIFAFNQTKSTTKFIFFSSSLAKNDPTSHYAYSKWCAEQFINQHRLESKEYILLRPALVFGKGVKGNLQTLSRWIDNGLPIPFGSYKTKRSILSLTNLGIIIGQVLSQSIDGTYEIADKNGILFLDMIKCMAKGKNREVKIWNIPKPIIRLVFFTFGLIGARWNLRMLNKITTDQDISSNTILKQLNLDLQNNTESELIKAFND